MPAAAHPPVALIIPGSGPTDRDGDNPLGVNAAPYRRLAEALAAHGIASLRIDKRGLFGSADAIPDPNAVTLDDYAADIHAWVTALKARTGAACIWLIGHSEGGLVALKAAADPAGICGVVLLATPGRPMGEMLREQFQATPANAPYRAAAFGAIAALEAGRHVDPATLAPPLRPLFAPQIQGFLISAFAFDPAPALAGLRLPVLIVQGGRDLQVSDADARRLAAAQPKARLVRLPSVNHVLKSVASDDRAANLATYADAALPLAPGVTEAIAGFIAAPR
ncbi:alpha/beta hydrolase [Ancylobacter defluvii]|uniref:Alpha/beta hydrolase n=1 Tax=Ancylobacter defluvii TaxID=1282440 RepID=A0A9W6JRT9_9HYPH|nr:alpha/beta fold hydrolase [Ancylobacter defluvii]MBS7587441.1 alpha/beta fold hydrolase [Ancylobacter defluvii]GLK82132.1 alpha/beta hydrolase [Ancylobacter defluvii]